jgi:hypothetical protein
MSDGPKKKEVLSSLATLDSAAGALLAAAEEDLPLAAALANLAEARLFPTGVRTSVDALREETGEWNREELQHDAIRRVKETLTRSPSWEVKDWSEVHRHETGEREFLVRLLGHELPVEGETLIPDKLRGDGSSEDAVVAAPSDFCTCAHTRGSHGVVGESGKAPCSICDCANFTLLGPGMAKLNVEEMPPPPEETLPESPALRFVEALFEEANFPEGAGAQTFMALQRLVDQGWRVEPPRE